MRLKVTWKIIKPYLLIFFVAFYILPLLTRIPTQFFSVYLWKILVLLALPITVLVAGIIIGNKYGIQLLYSVFIGVIFYPSGLIYGILPVWQYALWFFVIALISNLAAYLFTSFKKDEKKHLQGS